MIRRSVLVACFFLSALPLIGDDGQPAAATGSAKLSSGLIYSVDRTPEEPFDTPRGVDVITADEIWRTNSTSLADVLTQAAGFLRYRTTQASATGLVRGLAGRQILVLIDGVKVNDALYGDVTNMDLIDVSQIERIEIVRGVVSVLGTESLGGVINIITKRGPGDGKAIGGTVGLRFSSAAQAWATPLSVHGQSDKFRWIAGVNYQKYGNMRGGEAVGVQKLTDYTQRAGNLGFDYFLSPDQTVSFSYHGSDQADVKSPATMLAGASVRTLLLPSRLQLGSLAYQDLTDRHLWQALRVTLYSNVQDSGLSDISAKTPAVETIVRETDRMTGLNFELGSFVGSHHLVYGVDLTHDTVSSYAKNVNSATDVTTWTRGRYTNGAEYQTAGVYAQDQFDVTRWVTLTGGLRYGSFKTSGSEVLPFIGAVDLDSKKSDVTSMASVVIHAAPRLNLIGNYIRGFRAPNIRDVSRFNLSSGTLEIPNPGVAAERIKSYEAGVKYESRLFSANAFYFRNTLSNLLVVASTTLNGQNFLDANRNGVKDPTEPALSSNRNVGTALVKGYELDFAINPHPSLTMFGTYSDSNASTHDVLQATLVSRVPPAFGSAGVRYSMPGARAPWAELEYVFTKAFRANGVELSPIFREYALRAGLSVTDRWRLSVSGENLNDQRYVPRFTTTAYAGRRIVVGTEYRF